MDLANIIQFIYQAQPIIDFVLSVNDGVYTIDYWNPRLGAKPTIDEVLSHTDEYNAYKAQQLQAQQDTTTERNQIKNFVNSLKAGTATNTQVQKALARVITDLYK